MSDNIQKISLTKAKKLVPDSDLPKLLQDWKAAVETGDPAEVVKLYDPLAFLSGVKTGRKNSDRLDDHLQGRHFINEYFSAFMENKHNLRVQFNSIQLEYDALAHGKNGKQSSTYVGEYTFIWKDDAGRTHRLSSDFEFGLKHDAETGDRIQKHAPLVHHLESHVA